MHPAVSGGGMLDAVPTDLQMRIAHSLPPTALAALACSSHGLRTLASTAARAITWTWCRGPLRALPVRRFAQRPMGS